ncbi:YcnI family copper-binding membrane protein [Nakamurella endophytica]|uniref:YncI copper-binding domain-containing protein n=1 Tax=Nakamurella endophytica TaxID=1748367 RepID=A0A917WC06_9ACTN|nr:YcnI family protein [Nakamurella endophytica]GGL90049.1 hypothetical protein GCM10011594_07170 [Nakamurella endophytica]
MPSSLRRALTVAGASTLLILGPLAGAAWAHVGVTATDPTSGVESTITFRVPTEKDIPTTQVEVALPTDTPLTSVQVEAKDGWKVSLTKSAPAQPLKNEEGEAVSEIVTRIIWTATGDGIAPDEFADFSVFADPLPDADQLTFKVLQTYSDRTVVSWIEEQVAGGPEPDHPAPVLKLAAAPEVAAAGTGTSGAPEESPLSTGAATPTAATVTSTAPASVAAESPSGDGGALTLGWISLVVAVSALVVALLAALRRRRLPSA